MAAAAREAGARLIVAGRAPCATSASAVEDEITRRGGGARLPRAVVAQRDRRALLPLARRTRPSTPTGDLAKLDVGVHVDGWVVDTALTVNVGDRPENRPFVDAARGRARGRDRDRRARASPVRRVSEAIEATIRALRAAHRCATSAATAWRAGSVHCPPAIPNAPDGTADRLLAGAVVAIEPFATDGAGRGRRARRRPRSSALDPAAGHAARRDPGGRWPPCAAFNGLPFARRQLAPFRAAGGRGDAARADARPGSLAAYPPLVEAQQAQGRPGRAHALRREPKGSRC